MLLKAEIKKLFRFPLFWIIIAVCLVVNGIVIGGSFDFARNGIKSINSYLETGDASNDENGFCKDYENVKENAYDIYYADFDIKDLANKSQKLSAEKDSASVLKIVDKIYDKAAIRVNQIKTDGEGREEYYPGTTFSLHSNLYGTVFLLILMECCAIGILMTSYLMKYEEIYSTYHNIYSTKRGRKIVFSKGLASVLVTAFASFLIITLSVAFFLSYVPQLSEFLKSSVSSATATEHRGLLTYPFITWIKMSQLGYLVCASLMAIGYALLSSLLCFVLSFVSKNAYINALLTALLYILMDAQWYGFGKSNLFSFVQVFNPSIAMQNINSWFMEYVFNPQVSYQGYETLVLVVYILLSLLVVIPLWKSFKKKNIN